ncbi:MAG: hypothetical protein IPI23_15310 [Bacteroidetes bacterium]|nr:hypothetical protein [Bacteroidota bacterium]MBK8414566.1 hypothetical protein [Bacteroidota bacterium]MBK9046031.1 hypothetical protein [Bacteroidota bacterium]MBK9424607.1 hypothetical protein [Bacteroidota bacterium]MBL0070848.1 hypothetical protein [Bacteroidota bacterium]
MKTTPKLRFITSCFLFVLMNLNTFGQITLTVTPPVSGAGNLSLVQKLTRVA